jgi:hypothetical protein
VEVLVLLVRIGLDIGCSWIEAFGPGGFPVGMGIVELSAGDANPMELSAAKVCLLEIAKGSPHD